MNARLLTLLQVIVAIVPAIGLADKPEDAHAEPPAFWKSFWGGRHATLTMGAEYVADNGQNADEAIYGDDDNFWLFRNALSLSAGNRQLEAGLQLNVNLFASPPARVVPAEDFVSGGEGYTLLNYDNDARLERIYTTAHSRYVHLTLGDYSLTFGRGISLSMIRQDDIGSDNAMRGGLLEFSVPRRFKVQTAAGYANSLNTDPQTRAILEDDPGDLLLAARAEGTFLDLFSLGVHGVHMEPRFTSVDQLDSPSRLWIDQGPGIRTTSAGGSAEVRFGGVTVFVEGNGQLHDNYRVVNGTPVTDETGGAGYGEISWDLTPYLTKLSLLLKAEGILYYRWLMEGPYRGNASRSILGAPVQYQHMPTLELPWVPMRSLGNAQGGRLSVDMLVKKTRSELRLFSNVIEYDGGITSLGRWDDHPITLVVHPVANLRQPSRRSSLVFGAEAGCRFEHTDQPTAPGADSGYLPHGTLELSVPLAGIHSLTLKNETQYHALSVSETNDSYWVVITTLGYDLAGFGGIALTHEYSNEQTTTSAESWTLPFAPGHYGWAQLTFRPSKVKWLNLTVAGGSQRGGLKCAGGVCREYPDSVGARAEATLRF